MPSPVATVERDGSVFGDPIHPISSPPPTMRPSRLSDRFIPVRATWPQDAAHYPLLVDEENRPAPSRVVEREDSSHAYVSLLRGSVLEATTHSPLSPPGVSAAAAQPGSGERGGELRRTSSAGRAGPARNLLRYLEEGTGAGPPLGAGFANGGLIGGDNDAGMMRKAARKIARSPYKVLDAPNLHDDFYMNLVDWSASNLLAVGLSNAVYTWNATTCKVNKLMELPAPHPSAGPATVTLATGISWSNRGSYLAIGTDPGEVQLWDPEKKACIRKLDGHRGRCCSLAWNGPVLATGSRDKLILQRDVRVPGTAVVQRLSTHKSEVCGLKWSHDGRELASGGNDNLLCIWSARGGGGSGGGRTHTEDTPLHRFDSTTGPGHRAAIKALAWSPHTSGLLATGGGTADKTIRLWNTVTGTELQCVETGSQVCNLAWSQNVDELVSTHGYSQNQIILWRHPGMVKLATLTGHSMRVLYLAVSPDGQNIVTGAGDETLRFWNMFPGQLVRPGAGPGNPLSLGRTSIR